jgi:hypothetical protein
MIKNNIINTQYIGCPPLIPGMKPLTHIDQQDSTTIINQKMYNVYGYERINNTINKPIYRSEWELVKWNINYQNT